MTTPQQLQEGVPRWCCCQCMKEFDYEPILIYELEDDSDIPYQVCSLECAGDFREGVFPWGRKDHGKAALAISASILIALLLLVLEAQL